MKTSAFKSRQRGLTLIELMIGLTISVILAGVVLITMGYLYRQNIVSGNELATNNEARSALDKLSRDVSSAGFMIGGMQNSCVMTLSYNSAISVNNSNYNSTYAVTAQDAPGTTLALPTSPVITPAYPAGSNIPTDVLAVNFAQNATQFTNTGGPQVTLGQFGTTQGSPGQGALNSTQLPVTSTQGMNPGDMALLEVPMSGPATNNQPQLVCLRVPIVNIGPATGQGYAYVKSTPSSQMPSNGYADYGTVLSGNGYGTLSNGLLQQAKLLDIGAPSNSNEETVFYYVDKYNYVNNNAQSSWPVLMRTVVNAATDTVTSGPTPIAAGVVSLQALFGVAPAGTKYPSGGVTQYLTWPHVVSQNLTSEVRTVQIALVVRSLHPDSAYTAPTSISIPNPSPGDSFTPYPVQPKETHDHFQVYTTEVAIRNLLWHP